MKCYHLGSSHSSAGTHHGIKSAMLIMPMKAKSNQQQPTKSVPWEVSGVPANGLSQVGVCTSTGQPNIKICSRLHTAPALEALWKCISVSGRVAAYHMFYVLNICRTHLVHLLSPLILPNDSIENRDLLIYQSRAMASDDMTLC